MTTYLNSDEQTLNDLVILSRSGKISVFDLFNKTVTQGGTSVLRKLFRYPLNDAEQINRRSAVYQFFSDELYKFPVDPETMGVVVYYVENKDVRSQIKTTDQSMGRRLKDFLAADYNHIFIRDGVQATVRFFSKIAEFVKDLEPVMAGTAYESSFTDLKTLINDTGFTLIRQQINPKAGAKIDAVILADLDKQIRFDFREKLLLLIDLIYELDVFISVGQIARERKFCFAKALPIENSTFYIKKVYHPYITDAVPNDLNLNSDFNILFLTGANMAGKSTLMKSIGVALYLGHMGFPVAAEHFEFSVRDGIYTSINLSDNLAMGASHYYAEVLRVKEIAIALNEGKQLFVIFDELFRGTNVKDAHEATIALTRAFAGKRESQFIISTHIIEAGELMQKESLSTKYQFLPTEIEGIKPVYTRKLKNGITSDRQGMIIIQNEGILQILDDGIKKIEEDHDLFNR